MAKSSIRDKMKHFSIKNIFARTGKDRRSRARSENGYNATILIVDDSRTVLHSLKKILEQAGFEVLTALNGETGVHLAITHKPDLILMDLVMPGINGFQATRMIRRDEITKDIPIVIISGNEQASEKFWGARLGASGFMAKPIVREELFKSINELIKLDTLAKP